MIATVDSETRLDKVGETGVQAAFLPWPMEGSVASEVIEAIETRSLRIPRTITPWVSAEEIRQWLENVVPTGPLSPVARTFVLSRLNELVDLTGDLTGANRFMVRVFTGCPNDRCGFHIDTVPARAPSTGLLYVFNGSPTIYVGSEHVVGMPAFYAFLGRREALVRRLERAVRRGDGPDTAAFSAQIAEMDAELGFLSRTDCVQKVASGTVIAFKQLDVRLHWSDHSPDLVWIHSSPTDGPARLVVNIAGKETAPGHRAAPRLQLSADIPNSAP